MLDFGPGTIPRALSRTHPTRRSAVCFASESCSGLVEDGLPGAEAFTAQSPRRGARQRKESSTCSSQQEQLGFARLAYAAVLGRDAPARAFGSAHTTSPTRPSPGDPRRRGVEKASTRPPTRSPAPFSEKLAESCTMCRRARLAVDAARAARVVPADRNNREVQFDVDRTRRVAACDRERPDASDRSSHQPPQHGAIDDCHAPAQLDTR